MRPKLLFLIALILIAHPAAMSGVEPTTMSEEAVQAHFFPVLRKAATYDQAMEALKADPVFSVLSSSTRARSEFVNHAQSKRPLVSLVGVLALSSKPEWYPDAVMWACRTAPGLEAKSGQLEKVKVAFLQREESVAALPAVYEDVSGITDEKAQLTLAAALPISAVKKLYEDGLFAKHPTALSAKLFSTLLSPAVIDVTSKAFGDLLEVMAKTSADGLALYVRHYPTSDSVEFQDRYRTYLESPQTPFIFKLGIVAERRKEIKAGKLPLKALKIPPEQIDALLPLVSE